MKLLPEDKKTQTEVRTLTFILYCMISTGLAYTQYQGIAWPVWFGVFAGTTELLIVILCGSMWARSKGRNVWFMTLGLLGIPGFIVLWILKDKRKADIVTAQ